MPKDFIPWTFTRRSPADGDKIQANFNALAGKFPVDPDDVRGIYSSDIVWDVPVPPDKLPGQSVGPRGGTEDVCALLAEAPQLADLSADPLYANAFGLTFNRRYGLEALLNEGRVDIGWVSPCVYLNKFCFIVCDGFNDRVYIIAPSGGPQNMTVQKLAEFQVGTNPRHAVALRSGDIYVTCDEPSIWKISNGTSSELLTSTFLTGMTNPVNGLRKIYTNAFGTFLYAIAQGATYYDTVLRVALTAPTTKSATQTDSFVLNANDASPAASGTPGATNEIVDLAILYNDERGARNQTCTVVAAQSETLGTGGQGALWTFQGDSGASGSTWPFTFTGASPSDEVSRLLNPTGQSTERLRAMVQVGTSLFVAANYSGTPATSWAVVSFDQQERENIGGLGDGWVTLRTGTNALSSELRYGSACATPGGVYCVTDDAKLVYWRRGYDDLVATVPRANFASAGALQSSVAFNGRTLLIHATDVVAQGESLLARPFG